MKRLYSWCPPSNSSCKEQNLRLAPRWGIGPCRAFCSWGVLLFWFQRAHWAWTFQKRSGRQKDIFLMVGLTPAQLWCCFSRRQAPHGASSWRRDLLCSMQTALPVEPSPPPPSLFLSICTSKSFADVSNTYEYPCPWVQAEHFAFVRPHNPLNLSWPKPRHSPIHGAVAPATAARSLEY